jgi:hypothetical protein
VCASFRSGHRAKVPIMTGHTQRSGGHSWLRRSQALNLIRRLRPTPLDIVLVLGVASLAGFVLTQDRLDPDSPWLALWPNVTVDLFSVWLVARIIESFIASREKRRRDALWLRGAMNYTMSRAREVLPEPWQWAINTLGDEVEAMRTNADRSDLAFSREVRDYIREAAQELQVIASDASALREAQVLVRETRNDHEAAFRASERDRAHRDYWQLDSLDRLRQELEISRDHPIGQARTEIGSAVAAVRQQAAQLSLTEQTMQSLNEHPTAVEASLQRRADLELRVEAYATLVKSHETDLLQQLG